MKKSLSTVFALLIVAASIILPVNVFATNESDLLTKAKQTITINNKTIAVKSEVITQIERYLNQYEISDTDCQFISDKVDEAIELAKNAKASSWNSLTASQKAQMISLAEEINNSTSVKATLTSDGKLTIYNADGSVFTKISDALTVISSYTATVNDGASTSYTGVAASATVVVIAIAAAGAVLVSKKVSKANA